MGGLRPQKNLLELVELVEVVEVVAAKLVSQRYRAPCRMQRVETVL